MFIFQVWTRADQLLPFGSKQEVNLTADHIKEQDVFPVTHLTILTLFISTELAVPFGGQGKYLSLEVLYFFLTYVNLLILCILCWEMLCFLWIMFFVRSCYFVITFVCFFSDFRKDFNANNFIFLSVWSFFFTLIAELSSVNHCLSSVLTNTLLLLLEWQLYTGEKKHIAFKVYM